MDSTRRDSSAPDRVARRQSPGRRRSLRHLLVLAAAAGCSGITENADGIANLDVRLPANLYLEVGASVSIRAVARNADGDSVATEIKFLTADTTITVGEASGVVTARFATGTGRVQVAAFGEDTVLTRPDSLTFTLTARADTLALAADSVDVLVDTIGVSLGAILSGGSPRVPVFGRPITFTLIEPAAADSTILFTNTRGADSALTNTAGQAAVRLRGIRGRSIPDRAIVDVAAYRADGQKIPGSNRRIVVRFRHQAP